MAKSGAHCDIADAASATLWKSGRQFQGKSSFQREAGQLSAILAITSAM
jgi:hypothetical protein